MQYIKKFALLWIPIVAISGGLIAFLGCEKDKSTSSAGDDTDLNTFFADHPYVSDPRDTSARLLEISPGSASINEQGQTVVFTVTGGTPPLNWDVARRDLGSAVSQGDRQGRYTATLVAPNSVIVWDQGGNAAIASISGGSGSLSVTPGSTTLSANGNYINLTVSGGVPPYSWSVANQGYGDFNGSATTSGETVKYVRIAAGDNTVKVQDSNKAIASVTITQPTVTALAIIPGSAFHFATNGTMTFAGSGGTTPYVFTVSSASVGTINSSSGEYTALDAGANTITIWDAVGASRSVTVTQP